MKSKISVVIALVFCVSLNAQKIKWSSSMNDSFKRAQENNSLVLIYYYDSTDLKMTEAIDQKLFYNGSGGFSQNDLVYYLNDNVATYKADIEDPTIYKKYKSEGYSKYPMFTCYYPNGSIAFSQVGIKNSSDAGVALKFKIKDINDPFQEKTFQQTGTAHYMYLNDRFEDDVKEVQRDCDLIHCTYPVINRFFKAVPKNTELPYLLVNEMTTNALDPKGPEIKWILKNHQNIDLDEEETTSILFESLLYPLALKYGEEITEDQYTKEVKNLLKSDVLQSFGTFKNEVIDLIIEEIEYLTEE